MAMVDVGLLAPAVAGIGACIFTLIFTRRLRNKADRAAAAETKPVSHAAAE
jgi:hypothetical protein